MRLCVKEIQLALDADALVRLLYDEEGMFLKKLHRNEDARATPWRLRTDGARQRATEYSASVPRSMVRVLKASGAIPSGAEEVLVREQQVARKDPDREDFSDLLVHSCPRLRAPGGDRFQTRVDMEIRQCTAGGCVLRARIQVDAKIWGMQSMVESTMLEKADEALQKFFSIAQEEVKRCLEDNGGVPLHVGPFQCDGHPNSESYLEAEEDAWLCGRTAMQGPQDTDGLEWDEGKFFDAIQVNETEQTEATKGKVSWFKDRWQSGPAKGELPSEILPQLSELRVMLDAGHRHTVALETRVIHIQGQVEDLHRIISDMHKDQASWSKWFTRHALILATVASASYLGSICMQKTKSHAS